MSKSGSTSLSFLVLYPCALKSKLSQSSALSQRPFEEYIVMFISLFRPWSVSTCLPASVAALGGHTVYCRLVAVARCCCALPGELAGPRSLTAAALLPPYWPPTRRRLYRAARAGRSTQHSRGLFDWVKGSTPTQPRAVCERRDRLLFEREGPLPPYLPTAYGGPLWWGQSHCRRLFDSALVSLIAVDMSD